MAANATDHVDRIDLPVEGMTCASCVNRVTKGLTKVEGVERADVNLASGRATVVFDPSVVDVTRLRERIESLGYESPVVDDHEVSEAAHFRRVGRRLVLGAVLTVPTLLLSMVPALQFDGWQWLALSVPIETRVSSGTSTAPPPSTSVTAPPRWTRSSRSGR
jgi:P-type Cu+ transporter